MKLYPIINKLKLFITFQVIILLLFPFYSYAEDSLCARVKIEIKQELTLERQAFDAHMRINNGLTHITLTGVGIEVSFQNEDNETVTATSDPNDTNALFFIRIDSMENIADVDGNGSLAPSTSADIHWLIIPATGASNGLQAGTLYFVGATLTYSIGNEEHVTEVTPDYIYVKPMPELQLDYFLPSDVYGDDAFTQEIEPSIPFSLGVRVKNNGFGVASKLKINSAQPKIVENEQGLLINFNIEGSELNGNPTTDSLLINFGNIEPGKSSMARWIMTCSLSGRFVEFSADFSHSDELGGELTSFIKTEDLNTHFLVHDVLVDVPGRDNIRDFLGKDDDILRIYESDSDLDSEVLDQSASAVFQLENNNEDEIIYTLLTPVTNGFMYVKIQYPFEGQKVIKNVIRIGDQKQINKNNVWLSKTRNGNDPWQHFINLFDANSTGSYSFVFENFEDSDQEPVLQFIPDKSIIEKERISFIVEASDPNNTIPKISANPLPVGSDFIDSENGTGIFEWEALEGQAGIYNIVFSASDGILSDKQHMVIEVAENTFPDADITTSQSNGEEPLDIQFTDASSSDDGITSWDWNFGDGNASTVQNPTHTFEQDGIYIVLLTVTDRNGDSDSSSTTITVNDTAPSAAFLLTASGVNEPVNVTLSNNSESHDGITNYLWDFGDNHTSTEENPLHTYTQNGIYSISLTVKEEDGNSDTHIESITIEDSSPIADFSANPVYGNEPLNISFTDLSNAYDGITSWTWSFGDGYSSTEQNPAHTYSQDGSYTVTLSVIDEDGSPDSYTQANMIDIKAVRTVGASGLEYTSIQSAIDDCSDGDIVSVYPGVYFEHIDFKGKAIIVRAKNDLHFGDYETILDGSKSGSVVTFQNNETNLSKLEGFTIRNGLAENGAGIYMNQASPFIYNCIVIENQANTGGGGIYMTNESTPVIEHCSILNNHAYDGGGIYFDSNSDAIIKNSTITNNNALNYGGGLLLKHSSPEIINARLAENTSVKGAALLLFYESNLLIKQSTITFNKAEDIGGGLYCIGNSQCILSNSLITYNSSRFEGGAFSIIESKLFLRNCTISKNIATYGGAIFANSSELEIHNSILWNNSDEIDNQNTTLKISYSSINNFQVYSGEGNINIDPLFLNSDDDFRLQLNSPCIDAGFDSFTNTLDINGDQRPSGTHIDIGAYEWNNTKPLVDFTSSITKGHAPLNVSFADNTISSLSIVSYHWSFGDSYTSSSQNPNHIYSQTGIYDVILSVYENDGDSITYTKNAFIEVTPEDIPEIEFTAGPVIGYSPLIVNFNDQSSSFKYSITNWNWDFGDGSISNDNQPTHSYVEPGFYTVTLNITTAEGLSYSLSKGRLIFVKPDLSYNFIKTSDNGKAPLTVQFYDSSFPKKGDHDINWDFGDGYTSTVTNPVHTYTKTGSYQVNFSNKLIDFINVVDSLTTLTVCHESCQYTSIQPAIDASNNGDVIIVKDGIYKENINFKGKAIQIRSLNGKTKTTIDGNFSDTVVKFTSEEDQSSILDGFTIQNGKSRSGAGIYISDESSPIIKNCKIMNNEALKSGGGISVENNCYPALINCNIYDNQADYGGGISFSKDSSPIAYSITVSNNTAHVSGGGIFIYFGSFPRIINSSIHHNQAGIQGGGIYLKGAMLEIKTSSIYKNHSAFGGAISHIDSKGLPILSQCHINDNTSTSYGGGIYVLNTPGFEMNNAVVSNNYALNGSAFYLQNANSAIIQHSTIADNIAENEGAAIYLVDSNLISIKNSILWNSGNEIAIENSNSPNIEYSDIRQEEYFLEGNNNINIDPVFVTPGIDYHLGSGSPCRNTASSESYLLVDINGKNRPLGRGFDIGAYEETNLSPVGNSQQITSNEDSKHVIILSANDGDNDLLTYTIVSQPQHGVLTQLSYTITYEPFADYNGADQFSFKVNDGFSDSEEVIITLTIENTNDAPEFNSLPGQTAIEDRPYTYLINVIDIDPDALIEISSTNLPDWLELTDNKNGTAMLAGIPLNEHVGNHAISILADDGLITSAIEQEFTITVQNVNDAPELNSSYITSTIEDKAIPYAANYSLTDDEGGVMIITVKSSDETLIANDQISITGTNIVNNSNIFTSIAGQMHNFSMSLIPVPNAFGTVTITITICDTEPESLTITEAFAITIHSVNDAPSFANIGGQTFSEDSGTHIVENWATNISSGPANESEQNLKFNVTTNNPSLFTATPVVSISGSTGDLIYTLKQNANGDALVTVYLEDNGNTLNNGTNRSASTSFSVTVNSVNDPPSFTIGDDQEIMGYTGQPASFFVKNWASGMTSGPLNETGQTLTFETSDYETDIITDIHISSNGDLTYTPNQNANGTTNVSVWLLDGESINYSSGIQTFNITILAINHAPEFSIAGDVIVDEDCGYTTIHNLVNQINPGALNEQDQILTFDVSVDNPGIFQIPPSIEYTGTTGVLKFMPLENVFGHSNVIVTLKDNGGTANGGVDTYTPQHFKITIASVNDRPDFVKGSDIYLKQGSATKIFQNWASQIKQGPANETTGSLTFYTSPEHLTRVTNTNIDAQTGNLTITPGNYTGITNISVWLSDNETQNDISEIKTFKVTILGDNPPVISSVNDQNTPEDKPTGLIQFNVHDDETPDNELSLMVETSDTLILPEENIFISTTSASGRTIMLSPCHQSGTVEVTITVRDNYANTASESFNLTVHAKPYAEIAIDALYLTCGTAPHAVMFSATSVENTITGWTWNFGDGKISNDKNPTHTYLLEQDKNQSTYSVALTVYGPGGAYTNTKVDFIKVLKPMYVQFKATPSLGTIPLSVTFTDMSIGPEINYWEWNFGDGKTYTSTTESSVTYDYSSAGNYSITLTVQSGIFTYSLVKSDYINAIGRSISGRITGQDGANDLIGYMVEIQSSENIHGANAYTFTDEQGYYVINNLPALSNYILSVWPPSGSDKYIYKYYGGTDTIDSASYVSTIDTDQTINVALEKAPKDIIKGQIFNNDNTGISGILVEVYSNSIDFGNHSTTDDYGYYTITNLKSAPDYIVSVWSDKYMTDFYYSLPDSVIFRKDALYVESSESFSDNITISVMLKGSISGQVIIKETGLPVANSWISAWSDEDYIGNSALTDENGYYTINGLEESLYYVEYNPDAFPYQVYDKANSRNFASKVPVNSTNINFELNTGSSISGTIIDENTKQRLSGVNIYTWSESTSENTSAQTDNNGAYTLNNLPISSDYVLMADAGNYPLQYYNGKQYAKDAQYIDIRYGNVKNIDFALNKGPIIKGIVYNNNTFNPASSGIWVNVSSNKQDVGKEAPTDENGMYEITGLIDSDDYVISIWTTGKYLSSFYNESGTVYKYSDAGYVSPSDTLFRNIILIEGLNIQGVVTASDNNISTISVEAWSAENLCYGYTQITGNLKDGINYTIQGLIPGNYNVSVISDDYIENFKTVKINNSNVSDIDFQLIQPELSIHGTVAGLASEKSVEIKAWSDSVCFGKKIDITGNGSDVTYEISGLKPAYDYRLELTSNDYPTQVYNGQTSWVYGDYVDLSSVDVSNIDFILPALTASISGKITFKNGNNGDTAYVEIWNTSLDSGKNIDVKFNGINPVSYKIEGLEKDYYVVSVYSNIYKTQYYLNASNVEDAQVVDLNTNSQSNVDFVLSKGATIKGLITNETNQPLENTLVEITSDLTGEWKCAQTDDSGNFVIEGLEAGFDYIISASKSEYPRFYFNSNGSVLSKDKAELIQIKIDEIKQGYNIQLKQGEQISGTIRDSQGRGISGIQVNAYSSSLKSGDVTISQEGGKYIIEGLNSAKDYVVSIEPTSKQSYIPTSRSNVCSGSSGVDFILRDGFSLQGVVTSSTDGKTIQNVHIEIQSDLNNFYSNVKTNKLGEYLINGIPESDDYVIMITVPEKNNLSFLSEVIYNKFINANTYINISLKPAEKIYGYIYDENNNAIQGVKITAFSSSNNFFKESKKSDHKGYYEITNVPQAQDYMLTAKPDESSGFGMSKKTGILSGQNENIDFILSKGGIISGQVLSESGPIQGAHVIISSIFLSNFSKSLKTDSNGNYKFEGLPEYKNGIKVTDYKISVKASSYPKDIKSNITVGSFVSFKFTKSSLNILSGTVSDNAGSLLPANYSKEIKIFVYDKWGNNQIKIVKASNDGTGAFSIDGLSTDTTYKLFFVIGNYEHYESNIYDTSMIVDFKFANYNWND